MTNENLALERVLKARSALILARRFYGVLVSHVEPKISPRFPTAATNGKVHFFNPDYVAGLTQAELEAVQAHETEHDARHHGTRRGNRDPSEWNICCDLAINPDLIAEGFKLPKDVLFEERFRGMAAEDIYRIRELERKPPQSPPPSDEDEDSDDENQNGGGDDSDAGDEADDNETGEDKPGDDGKSDESDGEQGEQSASEEGGGEEPGDDGDDHGKAGGRTTKLPVTYGEEANGGNGESSVKCTCPAKCRLHVKYEDVDPEVGEDKGQTDGSEGEGEPQSCGDPGHCGEVLDSAEDTADNAEADQKWERVVRQAASMAKAAGQLPGHITREIERANNPGQDWREVLRAWIDQGSRQVETWNRPNRRFIGSGLYIPGKQRDGLNRVCFLIDTSGSMDDVALACVQNEAQIALDDGAIDEAIVIYGDTVVTRTDTYREGDEIEFDPRGGGGTDMKPLFAHVAEQVDDASLIINFTDLEWYGELPPEPSCPVLFAVTGYPDRVRTLIANSPWNAPAIDVGVH